MGALSKFSRYLLSIAGAIFLAIIICTPVVGDSTKSIAVVYPNLNSEYNAVFESIAEGIAKASKSPIQRIPLSENYSPDDLKKQLSTIDARAIIALGRRGLNASKNIDWKGPIVYGGVIWDNSTSLNKSLGITLDPDPHTVFIHLKKVAPHVKRVYAIIDREQSGWLVDRARAAAAELGFILEIKEITSHRAAAIAYRDLLQHINPSEDGLWLPLDPIKNRH